MPALLLALCLTADPAPPPAGTAVTFPPGATLGRAADAVRAQAGIPVELAGLKVDAVVALPAGPLPAWAAVDALAAAANARVGLKDAGRAVELSPGAPGPTATTGAFRVAVEQVATRLDFATGRSITEVTLTLHWEPGVPVFRVDGEPLITGVADDKGDRTPPPAARSRTPVRDCRYTAVVRLAGVPRSATRITKLEGVFTVTGAARMLTAVAPDLGVPKPITAEGVTVTVGKPARVGGRYEVLVDLAYPPPAAAFESFETGLWLTRNRLTVTSPTGERFAPINWDDTDDGARARVVYRFPADGPGAPKLDRPAGWSARVETPSPVGEYAVRFALKDIPLP